MSHWKPLDASLRYAVMITNAGGWRAPLPIRMGRIGDLPDRRTYPVDLRDHLIFPGLIL